VLSNNFDSEDIWFHQAKKEIIAIVKLQKVVTDREVKVRLEGEAFPGPPGPFPWVVGRAMKALEEGKILKPHGYRGRRRIGKGVPFKFYSMRGTPYPEIAQLIEKKRRISADINNLLTGEASASFHAENLFFEAFEQLGFVNHGRNKSEFKGKTVSGLPGKKPPDLDFIVERDGIVYGVDVKNWIRYEYGTRKEVDSKVRLAEELGIVPFIVARYVDREKVNEIIYSHGGVVYEYKLLILPSTLRSLAEDAAHFLGYPTLAVDQLPEMMVNRIADIHERFLRYKG